MRISLHFLVILSSFLLSTLSDSSPITMDKVNLNYSTKNILLPRKNEYLKTFIEKTEHFIRRMRWKAYHFLNKTESTANESYGFKSRKSPPQINELIPFEDDMINLIQNIKFNDTKCSFQRKLNIDIKNKIKRPDTLLIPADKTTNFYAMNLSSYDKLIKENVTKTYKKSNDELVREIDAQSARIAERLKLDDRIEKLAKKEAFITLKDHKPNFQDHPTCRLINPSKSEIGVISKHILDEINTSIINSTKINQWKNTSSVLKWFNSLENKNSLSFICFDVCEFYPSITEKLLSNALDFATKYRRITGHEREIILQAKRSPLFSENCPWEKKSANNLFDVTMGSFDGAETCELVGCYLLSILTKKYGQNIGLYRDDGLAAINGNPQEVERIKKGMCKVFRDHDLKITVEANTTKVNFLDITLDLQSGKHCPYTKEGNVPLYVHRKSNHPPSILKNIPKSINKRLSEISSDKECFDKAKGIYQEAFNKSGYHYNLSFNATPNQTTRPRINRQRNILWFNPPYSKNVETNVSKCFLSLIDKHFPKSNPLHKIFNRNTLKLSYSCMGNIKTIISNHNKAEINKSTHTNDQTKNCICRKPTTCPMDGNCSMESVIYQAEVTTPKTKETYIGLCDTTFKLRYRNHVCSFRNERYKHATELSKYIWNLKDQNIKYDIKWRIVKQARSYSNVTKRCSLCLWEKFFILCKPEMSTLNSRNELSSSCRHARKFLLKNVII